MQHQQRVEEMRLGLIVAALPWRPEAEARPSWGSAVSWQEWQRGLLQDPQAAASAMLGLQLLVPRLLTCSAGSALQVVDFLL